MPGFASAWKNLSDAHRRLGDNAKALEEAQQAVKIAPYYGDAYDMLGAAYTVNQASYDLTRLRLNGLIERQPRTNTYQLTADGQRVAIFYTKVHDRLLRPLIAADQPPAPADLRQALHVIDRHLDDYIDRARLPKAA